MSSNVPKPRTSSYSPTAMAEVRTLQQRFHLSIHRRAADSRLNSRVTVKFHSILPHSILPSFGRFSSSITLPALASSMPTPVPRSHRMRENPLSDILESFVTKTCITVVASSLLFAFSGTKPSLATPIAGLEDAKVSGSVEESEISLSVHKGAERIMEWIVSLRANDLRALECLLHVKMNLRKLSEAHSVVDRIMALQPDKIEWLLIKAHIFMESKNPNLAIPLYEKVIEKNPLHLDAYNGLVMAYSQFDNGAELKNLIERVEEAMEVCRKKKQKKIMRDFKLLIAQLRVAEGEFIEAKRIYEELVREDPVDFRAYLCYGILYTAMNEEDNAEKQFQKCLRLLPVDHPILKVIDEIVLEKQNCKKMVEMGNPSLKD